MKRWNKSWLLMLASTLAMGFIAEGEATLIKINNPRIVVRDKMPIPVIIVDSNGKTSEQTATYDPANNGIDLDTKWAGQNSSIFIPVLGVRYLWNNGNWVDEEGYYWDGSKSVKVADPQWKQRWTTYWTERRAQIRENVQNKLGNVNEFGENLRERGENIQNRAQEWQGRVQDRANSGETFRERVQDWQQNHPDLQERVQDWRNTQGENLRERARDWQESHPNWQEKAQDWRNNQGENLRERAREWQDNNPGWQERVQDWRNTQGEEWRERAQDWRNNRNAYESTPSGYYQSSPSNQAGVIHSGQSGTVQPAGALSGQSTPVNSSSRAK